LTKHPKKKSPPQDDSKKDEDQTKIEAAENQDEVTRRKKLLDKLFWIRMGLAAMAGVAATFLFESIDGEERRWASIGFMIIIFIASVMIGKGMRIGLPPSDRKKLVTTGIGSYVFIYLFMWILSYTLTHHPDTGLIPLNPL
jgi:multidrug transporter EmrE-like cation transporter